MKNTLLIFAILLTTHVLFGQKGRHNKIINPDTLVQRLGTEFMKYPTSVGLSVGLFYNNSDYTYNFGTVAKTNPNAPTNETVYAVGSVTKTFISLLLAQAVIDKKVSLDDDVRKYLKGNYPNLEYKGQPIRLKHLANTTSALPENMLLLPEVTQGMSADSVKSLQKKALSMYNRQSFFDALHNVKLDTIPGVKARHNNTAMQLLSLVLENVYGEAFSELVKNKILNPLGMKRTSFQIPGSLAGSAATGHDKNGNAVTFLSSPTLTGGGGLTSTSSDMLKYIKLQLDKNDKAVKLTHKKSFTPDIYSIGLNWLIYDYNNGYSQIWTDGGTYGFFSFIILYPELNVGIILLTNENDETSYSKLSQVADKIFNSLK